MRSPIFKKMFSTEMKEHSEGKVKFKSICWEATSEMFRYIYGMMPSEDADVSVLCDIFRGAHMFVLHSSVTKNKGLPN